MAGKSRILIIGGTGYIGKFIVEASSKMGHPTFALIRESTLSNPSKSKIVQNFKNSGGDIYDHGTLVNAIKQVDVVISTVGREQLADQTNIIAAIKEAGNVKRFFPSEFGNDADHVHPVEPAKTMYEAKVRIRRMVEDEGIPYTYVANNFFADRFLRTLSQPGATAPPRDKIVIFGDGNPEAVFNKEEDIATYTIKAVDDPQMKIVIELYKEMIADPPASRPSSSEIQHGQEHQPDAKPPERPPTDRVFTRHAENKTVFSGSISQKQQHEAGRPEGTYIVGGSAFGWNFVTFPGTKAIYYGRTKESFRSANVKSQVE